MDIKIQPGEVVEEISYDPDFDFPEHDTPGAVMIITNKHHLLFLSTTNCCAYHSLSQVDGNPQELIGAHVGLCELTGGSKEDEEDGYVQTWQFLKLQTDKGDITVRWHGGHNGYYCAYVSVVDLAEDGRVDELNFNDFKPLVETT